MTGLGIPIRRQYLLVASSLAYVRPARLLTSEPGQGARVFGLPRSAELLVTLSFLYYIHVNECRAVDRDYGWGILRPFLRSNSGNV
jgi:hypothetical protein